MIPVDKWIWQGMPAHFICAFKCWFRLCTVVGQYIISSVGAYNEDEKESKYRDIGCDRKFETFVFRRGVKCTCGCGEWRIGEGEIDALYANDVGTAHKNHMKMCKKYAGIRIRKG